MWGMTTTISLRPVTKKFQIWEVAWKKQTVSCREKHVLILYIYHSPCRICCCPFTWIHETPALKITCCSVHLPNIQCWNNITPVLLISFSQNPVTVPAEMSIPSLSELLVDCLFYWAPNASACSCYAVEHVVFESATMVCVCIQVLNSLSGQH